MDHKYEALAVIAGNKKDLKKFRKSLENGAYELTHGIELVESEIMSTGQLFIKYLANCKGHKMFSEFCHNRFILLVQENHIYMNPDESKGERKLCPSYIRANGDSFEKFKYECFITAKHLPEYNEVFRQQHLDGIPRMIAIGMNSETGETQLEVAMTANAA